jgi:hypothetical protein
MVTRKGEKSLRDLSCGRDGKLIREKGGKKIRKGW